MKVWTGSAWTAEKPVKYWNGSVWVTKPVKYWDGSAWVEKPSSGGATAPTNRLNTFYNSPFPRSDFDGEVGLFLTIGSAQTFTWVGMMSFPGNVSPRRVNIYNSGGTLVRAVDCPTAGKADYEYSWQAISPLAIAAGGLVYLLAEVTIGGDQWAEQGVTTFVPLVTSNGAVYRAGGAFNVSGANDMYVGLDLGW